jgi:hypothetical protein
MKQGLIPRLGVNIAACLQYYCINFDAKMGYFEVKKGNKK